MMLFVFDEDVVIVEVFFGVEGFDVDVIVVVIEDLVIEEVY